VRELRTPGSVRGALSNGRPYREQSPLLHLNFRELQTHRPFALAVREVRDVLSHCLELQKERALTP
jgi:hypothetical protein